MENSYLIQYDALEKGHALEQNGEYEKAYACYKQAADAGNPVAAYMLGNLYYYGRYGLVEKLNVAKPIMPWDSTDDILQKMPDYRQAFGWYEKSAEAGYVFAINNLGVMYHFGQGVEQNDEKAKEYLLLAAGAGMEQSAAALRDFYGMEVQFDE